MDYIINHPTKGNVVVQDNAATAVNQAVRLSVQDQSGRDVYSKEGEFVASIAANGHITAHGANFPMAG